MPRIKLDSEEPDIISGNPIPSGFSPSQVPSSNDPAAEETVPKTSIELSPKNTDQKLRQQSVSSSFSAFWAFPEKIRFEGEDDDENIILLMRAHVLTNIKWLLATLILLIAPIIFFPILISLNIIPPIGAGLGLFVTLFWYLGTFTYAFINFLYWYFNVYIVTDERIVDVDWYSIIYHKTSSTRIAKIQDVSATRIGVFAGIFDYGNVNIQTAAEEENFEFTSVPHPELIKNKIDELMEVEEQQWQTKPDKVT